MTDLIDRADSGEIPRYDSLGDEPTRNLAEHARELQFGGFTGFRRPAASGEFPIVDVEDTVTYLLPDMAAAQPVAPLERVVDLEGPQTPPPPLPPVPDEQAPATERLTLLGSLGADLPVGPLLKPPKYVGRHRHPEGLIADPHARPTWRDLARVAEPGTAVEPVTETAAPPWARVAVAVGVVMALGGGIGVALIWAVVR